MPDPKDYVPEGVTYVRGHIRRKRGTRRVYSNNTPGCFIWGILIFYTIFAIFFIIVWDPEKTAWIQNNYILVLAVSLIVIIASTTGFIIYKRNRRKATADDNDLQGK